jgi:hypothetical protein
MASYGQPAYGQLHSADSDDTMERLNPEALLQAAPWLRKYGARFLNAVIAYGISSPDDILAIDPARFLAQRGVGEGTYGCLLVAKAELQGQHTNEDDQQHTPPLDPNVDVLSLTSLRCQYPTRLLNVLGRMRVRTAREVAQLSAREFGRQLGVGPYLVDTFRALQDEIRGMLRGDSPLPTAPEAPTVGHQEAAVEAPAAQPREELPDCADLPLSSLWQIWDGLPVTLRGSLERHRLETVADVLCITPEEFLQLRGVGRRRVTELTALQEKLRRWLALQHDTQPGVSPEDESPGSESAPAVPHHRSLGELITHAVTEACAAQSYDGDARRNGTVWLERFGIGCDEPRTLEEVGQAHHITRERVRQIEKRVTWRVSHLFLTDPRLRDLLGNLDEAFAGSLGVIGEGALGTFLQTAMGWERPPAGPELSALAEVLEDTPHAFVQGKQDGFLWHASRCHSLWDCAAALALRQWEETGEGMHLLDFAHQLSGQVQCPRNGDVGRDCAVIPCCGAANGGARLPAEYVRAVLATLDPCPLDGDRVLGRWHAVLRRGRTKANVVEAALHVVGRPLHYRDLTQFICQHNPRFHPSDEVYVHCRLSSDHRYVLTGERGTYGLAEWGLARYRTAADRVEEYLERQGKPMAICEILHEMRRQGVPENNARAALYQSRFVRYLDDTVGLRAWKPAGDQPIDGEKPRNLDPFIEADDSEFILG